MIHAFGVNWNLNVKPNSPVTNLNEPVYDKTIYGALIGCPSNQESHIQYRI
jgi:hypothetical protein